MPKKSGLTKEQHFGLGRDLARIQDEVNEMIKAVGTAYLSNGREVKALERAGRAVEMARSVLDSAACRDLPGDPAATDAYYPADAGRAGYTRWSA
jgi:hypothetical protein